jgi:hypothetical protein
MSALGQKQTLRLVYLRESGAAHRRQFWWRTCIASTNDLGGLHQIGLSTCRTIAFETCGPARPAVINLRIRSTRPRVRVWGAGADKARPNKFRMLAAGTRCSARRRDANQRSPSSVLSFVLDALKAHGAKLIEGESR